MSTEIIDTTQSRRSLAASEAFAPFVDWLRRHGDKPKTAKKAVEEFVAEGAGLEDSFDFLSWLACFAICELEALDADKRLDEIASDARKAHIDCVRRGA